MGLPVEKMKSSIRMRWVERLRSGLYSQGSGTLHEGRYGSEPDKYCCLGVLCTIAEEDGIVSRHQWDGKATLPIEVAEWAGFTEVDPIIGYRPSGSTVRASAANDSGASFEAIASSISRTL